MRGLLLAAFVLAACADGAPTASSESAILNGLDEDGEEGTVYLYNTGGVACTGSLIGDRVVLTAKHCVLDVPEDGWFAGFGPHGDDSWIEAESVSTTAGRGVDGEDIALLTLRDTPGVVAYSIGRDFDGYSVGDEVFLVGYGETEDGSAGRKRWTTGNIESVGPDERTAIFDNEFSVLGEGTGAGHGDSGGPVLDGDGVQIGVMVRADLAEWTMCSRIDRFLDLVDAALDAAESEPPPEDPGQEPPGDPEGPVDPGPGAPLGAACTVDAACASGSCIGGACVTGCQVLAGESCPDGFYCDARGSCGDGACVRGSPGSRRVGNECSGDLDCATLLCADPRDGTPARCATPCPEGGGSGCGAGMVCHATTDGCGACLLRPDAGAGFGTGCTADGGCASGLCWQPGPTGVCSSGCGEGGSCPPGFACEGSVCAPMSGELGDPCRSKADCVSRQCGNDGESATGLCTASCFGDDDCGDGFSCIPTRGGEGACWPDERPGQIAGGCSTGGPPAGGAAWALLLALRRVRGARAPRAPRSRTAPPTCDGRPSQLVAHCGGVNPPPCR